MSEPIATSGSPYNTEIPSLDENADIQTALRYYHYGEDTSDISLVDLNPNSMAGHLDALENSKLTRNPATIPNNANLNENPYIFTGFFHQAEATWAQGATYPKINNVGYPGLLKVVNSGSAIYQEYHMTGVPGFNIVVFYRSKLPTGNWPANWTRVSDSTHIHDERYYQESESDDRFLVVNGQNNSSGAPNARSSISATPSLGDSLIFDGTKWVNGNLGYRILNTLYLRSNTTFSKASYPGLRAVKVRLVAGGGGGASANTDDKGVGGGGAGGYAERFILASDLPANVDVVVGVGGYSWQLVNNVQTLVTPVVSGGSSLFGNLVAMGGGQTPALNTYSGGLGGLQLSSPFISSPDFFAVPGGDGHSGDVTSQTAGNGGASFFGGGGLGSGNNTDANGQSGKAPGSGGGGAQRENATRFGGVGASGIVIIELYV
jgi:hypothetical protein